MKSRTLHTHVVFALALLSSLAPTPSPAETRSDVYNGATCIPYPPFDADNAVPYSYYMYGFRQSAFCHFTMPATWTFQDLSYVLFEGVVGSGTTPLRVRLCLYSSSSKVCGAERTIAPGGVGVNWVAPPGTPPSYASGAYLHVSFPTGHVSLFEQFIPVWTR
jgi:hypothetical protein